MVIKKSKLKLAIIAGASSALAYKEKKPSASESEVMNHVAKNIKEILEKIEEED